MGSYFYKDKNNNNYDSLVFYDVDKSTPKQFPSPYQNIYCFAYPTDKSKYVFDHWELTKYNETYTPTE